MQGNALKVFDELGQLFWECFFRGTQGVRAEVLLVGLRMLLSPAGHNHNHASFTTIRKMVSNLHLHINFLLLSHLQWCVWCSVQIHGLHLLESYSKVGSSVGSCNSVFSTNNRTTELHTIVPAAMTMRTERRTTISSIINRFGSAFHLNTIPKISCSYH